MLKKRILVCYRVVKSEKKPSKTNMASRILWGADVTRDLFLFVCFDLNYLQNQKQKKKNTKYLSLKLSKC